MERERELYGYPEPTEQWLMQSDSNSKAEFAHHWEKRAFPSDAEGKAYDGWRGCVCGEGKSSELRNAIYSIPEQGVPFMDIASSEAMGLASYILKLNPSVPCLVTDIDAVSMKQLRRRVNENFAAIT